MPKNIRNVEKNLRFFFFKELTFAEIVLMVKHCESFDCYKICCKLSFSQTGYLIFHCLLSYFVFLTLLTTIHVYIEASHKLPQENLHPPTVFSMLVLLMQRVFQEMFVLKLNFSIVWNEKSPGKKGMLLCPKGR